MAIWSFSRAWDAKKMDCNVQASFGGLFSCPSRVSLLEEGKTRKLQV
jgi:hypothetical protein